MSAFDIHSRRCYARNDAHGTPSHQSPLLCPPTPVRTPVWKSEESRGHGVNDRRGSLCRTKVLAEAPPPLGVVDAFTMRDDGDVVDHCISTGEDLFGAKKFMKAPGPQHVIGRRRRKPDAAAGAQERDYHHHNDDDDDDHHDDDDDNNNNDDNDEDDLVAGAASGSARDADRNRCDDPSPPVRHRHAGLRNNFVGNSPNRLTFDLSVDIPSSPDDAGDGDDGESYEDGDGSFGVESRLGHSKNSLSSSSSNHRAAPEIRSASGEKNSSRDASNEGEEAIGAGRDAYSRVNFGDRPGLRDINDDLSDEGSCSAAASSAGVDNSGAGGSSSCPSSSGVPCSPLTFFTGFTKLGDLGVGTFADVFKVRSNSDGMLWAIKRNKKQFRGRKDRTKAMQEVQVMQKLQSNCDCAYLLRFVKAWQEDAYFYSQLELCSRGTVRRLIDALSVDWLTAQQTYPTMKSCVQGPSSLSEIYPFALSSSTSASSSSSSFLSSSSPSSCDVSSSYYIPPASSNFLSLEDFGRFIPATTIWKIIHDVSKGLAHIHARNMVHLDIKPSNILFKAMAEPNHAAGDGSKIPEIVCKIGDFGMATESGQVIDGHDGDTKYLPKECLAFSTAKMPSSDMFSLGLMVLEMAAGPLFDLPSEGDAWQQIRSGSSITLPPCRTPELPALIHNLISPDPERRMTAEEVASLPDSKAAPHDDPLLSGFVSDLHEIDVEHERRLSKLEKSARTSRFTPTSNMLVSIGFEPERDLRTPTPDTQVPSRFVE